MVPVVIPATWDVHGPSLVPGSAESNGLSRSASTPMVLRPLDAPYTSPFGLDWLEREPAEFAEQRYAEARRRATKLVISANRVAFQRLGIGVAEPQPWPPPQDPEQSEEFKNRKRHPRAFYRQEPIMMSSFNKGGSTTLRLTAGSLARSASTPDTQPLLAPVDASSVGPFGSSQSSRGGTCRVGTKQKQAMTKLFDWGRCSHGSPYTYGQVFEEIDAKVHHRPVRDCRMTLGTLGPLQMGVGTTRAPRELPSLRKTSRGSSKGGDGSPAWARRTPQLALTQ